MIKGKSKKLSLVIAIMMVISVFGAFPSSVSAASELPNVEWWNFRNNESNNGVTNRPISANFDKTSIKWSKKIGTGWAASCTPPLIMNNSLYYGTDRYVYRVSKATGKVIQKSDQLIGAVGFALNPPTYAKGYIYIHVGNGQIQALNAKTLKSAWITPRVSRQQTLSPITYKNGHVYTGTWSRENKEGYYFCFDIKDEDTKSSTEIKKPKWTFTPAKEGDGEKGFYWAGSYASNNYVAFGSDDGTREGDYVSNSTLYTVHPTTGKVIDKKTKLKGDIRSTVVYKDGHLYFVTKGGMLYKVPVDSKGNLGEISGVNLGGMMTASPVVYNGRIYVGVAGQSQFDADSGHKFVVLNDTKKLSKASIAYSTIIPGYPQAAALLSTQYAKVDYNKDGKKDGRVHLYFTYNAPPGGIYYLSDQPGQKKGNAKVLYKPEVSNRQYSISTLSCDKEGTIYYKNDSGYMMAIEGNNAYIKDVYISTSKGKASWSEDFVSGTLNYGVRVAKTKNVKVKLNIPKGVTGYVNGKKYSKTTTVKLNKDGVATVKLVAKAGKDRREYVLKIMAISSNSFLSNINVSTNNTPNKDLIKYNPSFSSNNKEYTAERVEDPSMRFINIWPKVAATSSTVKVYGVEGIDSSKMAKDKSIEGYSGRYPVYFAPGSDSAKVKIKVISEDKTSTAYYYMTVLRGIQEKVEKSTVKYSFKDNKGIIAGKDSNKTLISNKDMTISYYDLSKYGIDGASNPDKMPTVLHLLINMTEKYYLNGGSLSNNENALTIKDGKITKLWGRTENLNVYVNKQKVEDVLKRELGENDVVDIVLEGDTHKELSYFDKNAFVVKAKQKFTLTLLSAESNKAIKDAIVSVSKDNGKKWYSRGKTKIDGKITTSMTKKGTYIVKAVSNGYIVGTAKVVVK
ncbi:MAG: cadherin-like beta sandwich domain-containing protein [Anaerovoracaceae bacterium]